MTDDFDAPPLDSKWTRRNVPMTDPVEALAAALVEQSAHFIEQPESFDTREAVAADTLAALRASGFDVVPTGDAHGRSVHAAWRDGMLAQGREVAPERMAWETLTQQDRDLDDGIAARLRVPTGDAHPDDGHAHSWGCRRCGVDPVTLGEATEKPTGEPAGSADAARESLTQRLVALDVADPHRIVAEFEAAIRAESTGTLNVAEAYDAGHSDGMQTHDDVGYCQHDGQKYARLSSSDTGGRVEPMTEQEMDDAIKDRRLPW